jgi:Scaffold protein Nfu/NifU N terminal
MKYRLQYLPDRERMVIHTSERVTSREYVRILSIHEVQDKDPGTAPGVEYELGRLLMKIPGVAAVVFQPYELEVRKGRLFEWNDLLPSIVDSIRQVCFPFTEFNEITPSLSPREPTMMVCPHCGFHKEV